VGVPGGTDARAARHDALLVAALTTVCHLPSLLRPIFDPDEAHYATVAELLRAGGRLYADGGVDFKPPGIYWTYAAVFDIAGRYAMWAVHIVALAVVVATALTVAAIAARVANRRAGVFAGVFYGVFTTVCYPKMLAANTEVFMMLPLAVAVWLVVARDRAWAWLAAGVLVAIATGYKQSAPLNLIVVFVAARTWSRAGAAALGFAVTLGAALVAVASTSSLVDMWHWCVDRLIGTYGVAGWRGPVLHDAATGFGLFVASSLVLWVSAAVAARRLGSATRGERVVWLWFAIGLASAFASGHFYPHYFIQPLAPLAVIAAIELDRRAARTAAVAFTALPAAAFLVLNLVFEPITERVGAPLPDFREPAAWIRDHTRADDRIFVWGNAPLIYVLADRLSASRFAGFLRGAPRDRGVPLEDNWDTGAEVWPALVADLAAHPPALVIDTSTADYMSFGNYPMSGVPVLAAIVAHDYEQLAIVGGVTMYRRR